MQRLRNYGREGVQMRERAVAAPAVLLLVLALALTACGSSESNSGSKTGAAAIGCLLPTEVSDEVNAIAEGFESSDEEVEAKQDAIAAVEAEAC
jgi:hypothetical protein